MGANNAFPRLPAAHLLLNLFLEIPAIVAHSDEVLKIPFISYSMASYCGPVQVLSPIGNYSGYILYHCQCGLLSNTPGIRESRPSPQMLGNHRAIPGIL